MAIKKTEKEIIRKIKKLSKSELMSKKSLDFSFALFEGYGRALDLLELHDEKLVPIDEEIACPAWYPEGSQVDEAILYIRKHFSRGGKSAEFMIPGQKAGHVYGAFEQIRQEIQGTELYPRLASKAANLFYFLIKNHYFVDGNKRIAVLMMLWFMDGNDMLATGKDGTAWRYSLASDIVYALAVFVAKSKPEDKKVVVGLLEEIIDTYRLKRDILPE